MDSVHYCNFSTVLLGLVPTISGARHLNPVSNVDSVHYCDFSIVLLGLVPTISGARYVNPVICFPEFVLAAEDSVGSSVVDTRSRC